MILSAKQISKSYHNGEKELHVLRNMDLELEQGEIVTIMGQSGAGKTTLLNILGTLDKPDNGSVSICEKDIIGLADEELSELRNKHLGFVFQFHHLLPEFTALENVLMPALIAGDEQNAKERADELFDYVEMNERKTHYPAQLSGGERLRVAVLRALILAPDVVFADEPTGNLDVYNAQRLLDLFQQINSDYNQAFVITTHNPNVAEIGNRRYVIENETLNKIDSI
ncbi:MAG TPA: ABC transporter ATP-binding protein [Candidatus Marinimicrobia bacterium]|jgi:lipoprotein-releasing system ATP-binding protein|nr:ABC transporter ATP-binding protein [Candidatus Neomarinimicrobiota bacterium]HJM69967.1 ABC transporter ATP-binding protein [Candidatus Neomarinimicrobiota bacterium]|tara:strand:- start:3039 stop:3716 length:678 start_codon:yes stop_codon:yes gene_type:complete